MESLTAEEVLQLWERGERLRPSERTLALLACARRGVDVVALADMTIGAADMTLLALRTSTFGGTFNAVDACPDCGTLVELGFDAAWLAEIGAAADSTGAGGGDAAAREVAVSSDGWRARFRLPTIGDLAALAAEPDSGRARAVLLERCLAEARTPDGALASAPELPEALQARVATAMEEAEPAAQLCAGVECPECGRGWQATVDVASFFWRELSVVARRLLHEVHVLASRYGWSEREILGMSAVRRHTYLEGRWA